MTSVTECSIRILLVDDEADLVEFLACLLLRRGCTVKATYSGPEALEAVKARTYDVAIVDLKMPQMDGIEAIKRIRAIQPFLEVIMLTGHGSVDSALEAGLLKTFRFLHKPYDFDNLMKLIQDACDRREQCLEAAYQEGMAKLMALGHTPREILAKGEELRHKYDRN
jgi:DNA-binding NtrC family response regulator